MDQEKVIVIDFGGQYNQLVARRVRECNVYCEIYSYKTDLAQIKAMKKIAAPIRVELAQYRELAAFSQFGSDLDADTKEKLAQGERIKEVLKQPQYKPMAVEYQVIIIYAATNKYLLDIPVTDITRFESELFEFLNVKYPEVPAAIREEKVISEETEKTLIKAIEECKAQFR